MLTEQQREAVERIAGPVHVGEEIAGGTNGFAAHLAAAHEAAVANHGSDGNQQDSLATSWAPVDLGPIVDGVQRGEIVGPVPTLMPRTDGVPLLYPGEIHSLSGEPESCKGWMVLAIVRHLLERGESVLYFDFEDGPASIISRLFALGTPAEAIVSHLTYVRPQEPFAADKYLVLIERKQFALAIIDGLSEAYTLTGLEINSNDDAAKFLAAIPRPLAARGAAVIEIDHVGRDKDQRGRYSIGAQHKLAGVAVAYGTEVINEPSRQNAGLVKLKIFKDRHGHVRGHAQGKLIALVHVVPEDDGERVALRLDPPDGGDKDEFRPTRLMEHTSRAIESQPGMSNAEIREAVKGQGKAKATALRLLIEEEFIEQRQDGRTVHHYSARPFREAGE